MAAVAAVILTVLLIFFLSPSLQRWMVEAELERVWGAGSVQLDQVRLQPGSIELQGLYILQRGGGWQVRELQAQTSLLALLRRDLRLTDGHLSGLQVDLSQENPARLLSALPELARLPNDLRPDVLSLQAAEAFEALLSLSGWSLDLDNLQVEGVLFLPGGYRVPLQLPVAAPQSGS